MCHMEELTLTATTHGQKRKDWLISLSDRQSNYLRKLRLRADQHQNIRHLSQFEDASSDSKGSHWDLRHYFFTQKIWSIPSRRCWKCWASTPIISLTNTHQHVQKWTLIPSWCVLILLKCAHTVPDDGIFPEPCFADDLLSDLSYKSRKLWNF